MNAPASVPLVEVSGLIFEYPGLRALKDIEFSLSKGSVTALVGPNGAGKTTLMRCIASLEQPLAGEIRLDGLPVHNDPRRVHARLGYLSDAFGLYDDLTVRQNIAYMARAHRILPSSAAARVEEVIEQLELTAYAAVRAGTLSRGWRQRLGMAMVMVHDPELLLLDEPASGLDPEARTGLSRLFRQLQSAGKTLLVSSHILAELEDYCTDMLVLRQGRLTRLQTAAAALHPATAVRRLTLRLRLKEQRSLLDQTLPGQNWRESVDSLQCDVDWNDEQAAQQLRYLIEAGLELLEWRLEIPRLQDVYLALADGQEDQP